MWKAELGRRGIMPGHAMNGILQALGKYAGVPLKIGDRIAPVY